MWGHRVDCGCLICNTLPRIFSLVSSEIGAPAYERFVDFVGNQLRHLEGELRDELSRRHPVLPPSASVPVAPPTGTTPRETQEVSQPKKPEAGQVPPLHLACKVAPPVPPPQLAAGAPAAGPSEAKEEPKEEPPEKSEGEAKAAAERSPLTRARSSGVRRSQRSADRRRGEEASPSRKKEPKKKKSKDRDRKRRRSTSSKGRRSEGGREKKRRHEKPPEPDYPPNYRREQYEWGPRDPGYPPPVRQGPGWQGVLPRSDHPRWSQSENKGQVKRAKQELYSRRHYR